MEAKSTPSLRLEGTYCEQDIRAFSAFLAARTARSRLWTLGVLAVIPLLGSGNIRQTWPLTLSVALVLIGFLFLLRYVLLPIRLYRAATRLPGLFTSRIIEVDAFEVKNTSGEGGHTFRLDQVQEVIEARDHLFVMVAPRQGIPVPKAWIGDEPRIQAAIRLFLSKRDPIRTT